MNLFLARQGLVRRLITALAGVALAAQGASAGPGQPQQGCVTWDNGPAGTTGQISHLGGDVPDGLKAADDFYLCDGFVYKLESITASMATSSHPYFRRAILEFYEDCDGCPGDLLFTLVEPTAVEGPILPNGFVRVDYTFTTAGQPDLDLRSIVLNGGTYWVSAIGLSDNQQRDSTAFLVSTGAVKGRPAKKRIGVEGPIPGGGGFIFPDPWLETDDCCLGCTDLAFTVQAHPCKLLIDNGHVDTTASAGGVRSENSGAIRDSRAADDFVVGTCADVDVCYLRACIWTNCDGIEGIAEIYSNACNEPRQVLGEPPLVTRTSTRIVPLDVDPIVIEGHTLRAYLLEFDLFELGPNGRFMLPRARHYWLSISVRDSFSSAERAYFCYKDDCGSCPIRFNPAQQISAQDRNVWSTVDPVRELAFLVAAEPLQTSIPIPAEDCDADTNHDGQVTAQDLFDFVAAWFQGCP